MSVILGLIAIDVTTPYNCEVCHICFCLTRNCALTGNNRKIETIFQLVSNPYVRRGGSDTFLSPPSSSLGT